VDFNFHSKLETPDITFWGKSEEIDTAEADIEWGLDLEVREWGIKTMTITISKVVIVIRYTSGRVQTIQAGRRIKNEWKIICDYNIEGCIFVTDIEVELDDKEIIVYFKEM